MYRALLTVITVCSVSVAFAQSTTEPLRSARLTHILIKAKCAFPDGKVVSEKLIKIDATASAAEKRAVAEQACEPVMAEASAKCDDLANRVDALRSEARIVKPYSWRAHELADALKDAAASAPDYCK